MFLLISFVILFACQNSGQQAYKDDIVSVDSTSVVTNDSHENSGQQACKDDIAPVDSTLVVTNDSHDDTILPDSAEITIFASPCGMDPIVFSIHQNKESTIEYQDGKPSGKEILSKTYSDQILRKTSDIFLEHKTPIIIAKKIMPEYVASDYLPLVEFVIYSNDDVINEYLIVYERQSNYELTYSDSFLELYNLILTNAIKFHESRR